MKTVLILAALAIFAAVNSDAAVLQTRANLIVGVNRPGDVLLSSVRLGKRRIANAIQSEDFVYRGAARTNITSVRGLEVGVTQYARFSIINGGVGRNNVTVRVQSSVGYGYNVTIQVYGKY